MSRTNGHGPKKVILYARVSTDEQARSGYSLAQQTEALREYAAREGHEILEEVTDPGQSGASLARPGLDRCVISCARVVSAWCWPRTGIASLGNLPTITFSSGSSR